MAGFALTPFNPRSLMLTLANNLEIFAATLGDADTVEDLVDGLVDANSSRPAELQLAENLASKIQGLSFNAAEAKKHLPSMTDNSTPDGGEQLSIINHIHLKKVLCPLSNFLSHATLVRMAMARGFKIPDDKSNYDEVASDLNKQLFKDSKESEQDLTTMAEAFVQGPSYLQTILENLKACFPLEIHAEQREQLKARNPFIHSLISQTADIDIKKLPNLLLAQQSSLPQDHRYQKATVQSIMIVVEDLLAKEDDKDKVRPTIGGWDGIIKMLMEVSNNHTTPTAGSSSEGVGFQWAKYFSENSVDTNLAGKVSENECVTNSQLEMMRDVKFKDSLMVITDSIENLDMSMDQRFTFTPSLGRFPETFTPAWLGCLPLNNTRREKTRGPHKTAIAVAAVPKAIQLAFSP